MSLSTPGVVLCVAGWRWDAPPGAPGLLKAAGPSPGPLGSSLLAQHIHQTAKCRKRFQPCREGWAGKISPPASSLFLRGLCFLRNFNLSHVLCVTM